MSIEEKVLRATVEDRDRTIADLRKGLHSAKGCIADLRALIPGGSGRPRLLEDAIAALPASMRALPLPEAIAALADELQDALVERDAIQAVATMSARNQGSEPSDDMERLDNALARVAGDIANAREYARRLTISLAEYESLPVPDDQPSVTEDVLEDPRMDGTTWLEPATITRAIVASWPVWELRELRKTSADTITIWRSDTMLGITNGECPVMLCDVEWRPLRLPGMGRDGVIQASDMTAEHFQRVRDWQYRDKSAVHVALAGFRGSRARGEWTTLSGPAHISVVDDGEEWRPACFAPRNGGEE